jgi:DNA-binding NarL/FixJ family response regulator
VTVRVLVADDQTLVRHGFAVLLRQQPGIEVVGEAADGAQAVELAATRAPDIVLMDVRMPVLDGIGATERITAASASRVVMLTTFDDDDYVLRALRAGASGFLLKDVRPELLVDALRVVAGGDALLAPSVTRRLIERHVRPTPRVPPELARLTAREREVLIAVARGWSNDEIAARLVLSHATVKSHVSRLLAKLALRDRVQAVVFAYETGLVQPGSSSRTNLAADDRSPPPS